MNSRYNSNNDKYTDIKGCPIGRVRQDINQFYVEAHLNNSGQPSLDEFEAHLEDDKVKAYFLSLALEESQDFVGVHDQ